jgi:hypothetical protein
VSVASLQELARLRGRRSLVARVRLELDLRERLAEIESELHRAGRELDRWLAELEQFAVDDPDRGRQVEVSA